MATSALRLIQDQNSNLLYNGTTPGGKTDLVPKADKKKGGLGARKALNDISNSRKPSSVFPQPTKKDKSSNVIAIEKDPFAAKAKISKAGPEKAKVSGRKALSDLTNSVKPSVGRKLKTVAEENNVPILAEERFLHNHKECIKSQMNGVDMDYFLKSVGLNNDMHVRAPAMKGLKSSSKKAESSKMKNLEMEEIFEEEMFEDEVAGMCQSPKSPKPPYANWDDDNFSDLMVIETPKLLALSLKKFM